MSFERAGEDTFRGIFEREQKSIAEFHPVIFSDCGLEKAQKFLCNARSAKEAVDVSLEHIIHEYGGDIFEHYDRMRTYEHRVLELERALDDWSDDPPMGDARERALCAMAHLDAMIFGARATIKKYDR